MTPAGDRTPPGPQPRQFPCWWLRRSLGHSRARAVALGALSADGEAGESGHRDVLAELGDRFGHEVADLLLVVLDPRLFEQADLGVEGIELAGEDLLHDVLRLALHLLAIDGALALDDVRGNVLATDVRRRHADDLECERMREVLEVVGLGDEVRFAVDLDERALLGDAAGMVDVRVDEALIGAPPCFRRCTGGSLGTQPVLDPVHVAVASDQGALAVHHPRAGALPQGLDHRRGDLGHQLFASPAMAAAPAAAGSSGGAAAACSAAIASACAAAAAACSAATTAAASAAIDASRSRFSASWRSCSSRSLNCCSPSAIALPISVTISRQLRIASSLPGITTWMSSGSQLVSTIATIGMFSLLASVTAMCSFLQSMTKTAPGSRFMSAMPAKLFSRRSRSSFASFASLPLMRSKSPLDCITRSSARRRRRRWMTVKLVSIPPIQRWVT